MAQLKKADRKTIFTCPQAMCRKVACDNFSQNTAKPIKIIRERMLENKLNICSVVNSLISTEHFNIILTVEPT